MSKHVLTLYALVVLVLFAVLATINALAVLATINAPDDQDLELKHHCEMVHIYRESGGEYGWPDYNNTAHLCPEV
jgi:hypothetical protein